MNHAIKLLLSPVFADLEAGFFPTSVLPVFFVSFCATVRVVSAEPSALIVYVPAAPSMILYVTGAATSFVPSFIFNLFCKIMS